MGSFISKIKLPLSDILLNKRTSFLIFSFISFLFVFNPLIYDVQGEDVNNGAISITFDDNYSNQFSYAWELMEARGIVGTYYVFTNTVNTPGYMSYNALQTLQAAGNEIASHSVTHTSFTSLNDQQILDECVNSKALLETNGLVITNFAYPNGDTNSHVDSIVDDYYDSGRTAFVSPFLVEVPTSQFRIPGFNAENEVDELELLNGLVDQIYNTNSWGVFLFHNVLPGDYSSQYTTSQEDFEDFLDYVILKGLPIITIRQGLEIVNLSLDSNIGNVSPISGKYTLGSEVVVEAFAPVAGVGERFVWEGWSGSGAGSYSGFDNPATVTMNGQISQVALWRHEHLLTVSSNFGEVVPSVNDHWYEVGSEVVVEAFAPVAGVGERFVWEGWSGSGAGSYSGFDNPVTIIMNNSISEIATWNHQYRVFVNQNGAGLDLTTSIVTIDGGGHVNGDSLWLDSGSTHSYSILQEFLVNQGKKYTWFSSSGLTTQQSGSIFISRSGSIIANYKTQNYVDVISPYGDISGAGWYDLGDYAYAKVDQTVIEVSDDIRYVFTGWTGDGSGFGSISDQIIVNNSLSIIASWQTEYLFLFNQEGLPNDYEASLLINSENQSTPLFMWINEGKLVEYVYLDKILTGSGTQYVLTPQLNQSLISNSPTTITANYSIQYTLDFFIMVAIIVITGSLAFVIIFLKRKNMI